MAFLSTPSGYRYAGRFQGAIVPVSRTAGDPPRVLTRSRNGGACMELTLREMQPDGMHQVAQGSLRMGVAEDSRLYEAIFGVPVAAASEVRRVFTALTMKALLINVVAQVPELSPIDEGYEVCGTAKIEYNARGASLYGLPHLSISITTHDSIEEATHEIETSIQRWASGAPPRRETVDGQIMYVWDRDAGTTRRTTILARVGKRVIGVDSQQQLAALAMRAMRVLLPQVEAVDGK